MLANNKALNGDAETVEELAHRLLCDVEVMGGPAITASEATQAALGVVVLSKSRPSRPVS